MSKKSKEKVYAREAQKRVHAIAAAEAKAELAARRLQKARDEMGALISSSPLKTVDFRSLMGDSRFATMEDVEVAMSISREDDSTSFLFYRDQLPGGKEDYLQQWGMTAFIDRMNANLDHTYSIYTGARTHVDELYALMAPRCSYHLAFYRQLIVNPLRMSADERKLRKNMEILRKFDEMVAAAPDLPYENVENIFGSDGVEGLLNPDLLHFLLS